MSDQNVEKSASTQAAPEPKPAASGKAGKLHPPPLFRRIDWLTFAVTTLLVMVVYMLTLAPDLTLEDSGELAVASFYAGIPHPPGYPVWTLYTYLFANFLPIANIAWRVAVGSAFAGALSSGLIALMVSRGSSMMIEGISGLKGIERRRENLICIISGFAAGCLIGFNGYMWSQAVIVEVYSLSVLSLVGVLVCLMRWLYAPHQKRYLYWALFIYGICFTNHQTLLLAAVGLEVAIAATDHKLGRNLFLWNTAFFFAGLILRDAGMLFINTNQVIFWIFIGVGMLSIGAYLWLAMVTKESFMEFCRDAALCGTFVFLATAFEPAIGNAGLFLALVSACGTAYLGWVTRKQGLEWLVVALLGLLWVAGAAFYFYMPISGMTNPPMEWGYPRTEEGFWHALTRGQYEKANPTDIFGDPLRFLMQLGIVAQGIATEFNWVYTLIALVPFFLWIRMQKRERAWLTGLTAIYLCMAILLVIMLNPSADRASRDLTKVFFAASHVFVAMFVGYGLTLIAAMGIARHGLIRHWLPIATPILAATAFDTLLSVLLSMHGSGVVSDGIRPVAYALACLTSAGIAFAKASALEMVEEKAQLRLATLIASAILAGLALVAGGFGVYWVLAYEASFINCLHTVGHSIAYLTSHVDVTYQSYGALLVVLLTGATILLLRRKLEGKRLALLLAVFAAVPAYSVLSHWFDNEQHDHLFGFWFGHDMFTPPFTDDSGRLSYDPDKRKEEMQDPAKAKLIYPEMARDAILFGGTDPGRFCPTYMIFCESFIPPRCKPHDPLFDRRDVYIITQNALADGTYLNYIRAQYNKTAQIPYDTPFFLELLRSKEEEQNNYKTNFVAKLAYNLLDKPLTKFGAKVEAKRRAEGVYPPKEIYIPTPQDSQVCFENYLRDAQIRKHQGRLKPGELVQESGGKVQVSGQVAVMAINGLLTKVIFDHNPSNEFYVEESFPLDWMYPHLTPYGIIMKINRKPLPDIPEEDLTRDHEFWSKYSERLIGNWITYDTSIQEIADFAEKVYLRHDFSGFTGDRKFVRDDQGQKAFSKLRSSIAGVYAWRLGANPSTPCPPEYAPKTPEARARLLKEADFAFRQAFAFCPYSPEAVYRYVQLLMQQRRIDDALLVAKTCQKLDPFNDQIVNLVNNLTQIKASQGQAMQSQNDLMALQKQWRDEPTNLQLGLNFASGLLNMQQTQAAIAALDQVLASPYADRSAVLACAQAFSGLQNLPKLETTLKKLTEVTPDSPEAWFDFAAIKAFVGKPDEAIPALKHSLALNDEQRKTNPAATDLRSVARGDARFATMRDRPDFQALIAPQ